MTLSAGTRLEHYEILELIGRGGMGEVFRARDTKLKRDVAIKVLPEAFASDEQRMKRFAREAEVLASLNHPNIASIYGLEESDGITALVLELVEGPTLAERIAEGPIPLDEALPIAGQMAEGLEAAHEQGIIHRDLKPANVKVREDGTVKLLDFGLAKALDEDRESEPSESPTMSAAATRAGVIMGTAAYMSPEQARGKPVDRRADIWAFGVVLYEMLTGRRMFEAEDVSLTLAEVMKSEPQWDALPSDVSPTLRTYLARCLQKDPKERVRDIGDVRLALEGAFEVSAPSEPTASKPRTLQWIATVVVTSLVAGFAVWSLTRPAAPRVVRLTVSTPPSSAPLVSGMGRDLAISPDGEWHVYWGVDRVLHVRHIDRFETTRLDLVNPNSPFVSPRRNLDWIRSVGLLAKDLPPRRPTDDDLQDRGQLRRRELGRGRHYRFRNPNGSLPSAGRRRSTSAADIARRR
jgi:serine/threonine-protein kinase